MKTFTWNSVSRSTKSLIAKWLILECNQFMEETLATISFLSFYSYFCCCCCCSKRHLDSSVSHTKQNNSFIFCRHAILLSIQRQANILSHPVFCTQGHRFYSVSLMEGSWITAIIILYSSSTSISFLLWFPFSFFLLSASRPMHPQLEFFLSVGWTDPPPPPPPYPVWLAFKRKVQRLCTEIKGKEYYS